MEEGENVAVALGRELREEAGHVIEGEPVLLGTVEERWHEPGDTEPRFVLESHYYAVRLGSGRCALNLDDYEAALGFVPVWQTPAEAIAIHEALIADPPEGLRSWIRRETAVLRWLDERQKPEPTGDRSFRRVDASQAPAAKSAIGIDIDGCLVDTIRHSAEFLSGRTGRRISQWDIIHGWTDITDIDRYFADYGYELLGTLPPYAHAQEVIASLCASHEVYLVSARCEYNRDVTNTWLERHGIRPREVILTAGADKLTVCRRCGIGIFVEDSPINARSLADAGIPVLLLDTEYNRYLEHPGVRRCRDWPQIGRQLDVFLGSRLVEQEGL
jgi:uncharacterized HAD superfamily protein